MVAIKVQDDRKKESSKLINELEKGTSVLTSIDKVEGDSKPKPPRVLANTRLFIASYFERDSKPKPPRVLANKRLFIASYFQLVLLVLAMSNERDNERLASTSSAGRFVVERMAPFNCDYYVLLLLSSIFGLVASMMNSRIIIFMQRVFAAVTFGCGVYMLILLHNFMTKVLPPMTMNSMTLTLTLSAQLPDTFLLWFVFTALVPVVVLASSFCQWRNEKDWRWVLLKGDFEAGQKWQWLSVRKGGDFAIVEN